MALRPYSQTLQQAYRDTLGTPGAPEAIDDSAPVVPVAVVAQVNTASTAAYMQLTDGVDSLTINTGGSINSSLPSPAGGQVIVSKTLTGSTTGDAVHTVTAGKTFYCAGVWVGSTTAASTASNVLVAGVVVLHGMNAADAGMLFTGGVLFSATSGQVITFNHGAGAGRGQISLWGWEQ